jgi:hypothetical protein
MPNKGLLQIDIKTIKPDQFSDYISQLNEIFQNSSSDSDRKQACLKLAFAHINHRNPVHQYDQALRYFNHYEKLEPDPMKKDDLISWMNLLEQLLSLRTELRNVNMKLSLINEKNQNLAQQANAQAKTIRQLENKIKRLDVLYFKIEKKKKKNNNK